MQIFLIPDLNDLDACVSFSSGNSLGWEFNDFALPGVYDDRELARSVAERYQACEMPRCRSLHGAFLDILIHSADPKIREISQERIEQSMEAAAMLRCEKAVFHTNFIPNFDDKGYIDNWLTQNAAYWTSAAAKYPAVTILMENMYDMLPDNLAALAEKMSGVENFGVCLDYAHSVVFGRSEDSGEEFVSALAPYVRHIHLNDCDLRHDLHLALGDGLLDWDLFADLYGNYLSGVPILLEVNGLEKQKRSLDFLRGLMTRHGIAIG